MQISLAYGKETVSVHLPRVADIVTYHKGGEEDQEKVIQRALQSPINSPPLHELAKGKRSAVILISDRSRLSPSHLFLPYLLQEIEEGGMKRSDMTIIVALGMHRKQTEEELRALVGDQVWGKVKVMNHSAHPEDCVYLGTTSRGTPVEILRNVAESDLCIVTGNIEPHAMAGFSGGLKAIMPGVASQTSIEQNHSLSQKYPVQPGDAQNPIREDMEEAAHLVAVHFLLNVIVDHRGVVMEAAAGDARETHRILVTKAQQHFLVSIEKKYDLVIASTGGYPKDIQLYQAVKTLQNAAKLTRPGGHIVLVAKCQEGFGNGLFQYWVETIQDHSRIERLLRERFVLGAHKINHIGAILKQQTVGLYSDMPLSQVQLTGLEPVFDLQAHIELYAHRQDIAVMPFGALTFPRVTEKSR